MINAIALSGIPWALFTRVNFPHDQRGDIPHGMGDSIYSPIHKVTVRFFIEKRKALGLRQADLAKLVHRSRYWVSDLELGRRRIDHVEYMRICRALGIAPGRFMTRKLEPLADNNARTGGAKTRR